MYSRVLRVETPRRKPSQCDSSVSHGYGERRKAGKVYTIESWSVHISPLLSFFQQPFHNLIKTGVDPKITQEAYPHRAFPSTLAV
jgi:hypothetical protein